MKENNNSGYTNRYLIQAFKDLGKSQKEIIKELGKSQPYVSALMSGKKQVGRDIAEELNKLYGFDELAILKGSILKDSNIIEGNGNITGDLGNNATINIDNSGFNKELSDAQQMNVALMGEKIDYLERKIKKGEVELKDVLSLNVEKGLPYYNVDFINGFSGVEEITHEIPEYNISYPPANQCNFWVNATGESMRGVVDNGDKIALKVVDKEWFPLGEVYAIITTNGHRMIKKITKSEDKDCYKLVSANPDKEAFPDQDIPKEMIQSLFKVVVAIKFIH